MSGLRAWWKSGARWVSLLLVPVLVFLGVARGGAAPPSQGTEGFELVELPPEAFSLPGGFLPSGQDRLNPALDATLNDVARSAQISVQDALRLAQSMSLRTSGVRVQVQVVVRPSNLPTLLDAIARSGGEVTGVGHDDTLVQGWLPVDALETIAAQEGVYLVRRPAQAVLFAAPDLGNSVTEGLVAMNAPAWHASGHVGWGVRVGIVDMGFLGYTSLLGTDLPPSVVVGNFVDGESQSQVDGTTEHGTACAEVVHDVAPGAAIYLAKVSTNLDLVEAVTWLSDTHHVDVISTSLGWYNLTPGDGTGEFADLVQSARDAGILWATAASNDRENHWGGLYADVDMDNVHEFDGREINCFGPGGTTCYNINPGYALRLYLRWSDWADVDQDYHLYLVRWNGSTWVTFDSSTNVQDGSPGQTPTEFISTLSSGTAAPYGVVIQRYSGSRAVNFELFAPKMPRLGELLHPRSLANLADAPDAITVAALDVTSPYPQEAYSSEGPTNGSGGVEAGGFIKPDISGYANVATESYTGSTFNGTSSATPHVAGAAALVFAAYPGYTADQVQDFLEGRAIDMGSAGMDTLYGHGRLYLGAAPAPAPIVTSISPPSGVNTGTVSITNLAGSYFAAGATVALIKSDQAPITATSVTVVSPTQITCALDLTGTATGLWDVVVTNTDGRSGALVGGFEVRGQMAVYAPLILRAFSTLPQQLYPTGDACVLQGAPGANFGATTDMWVGYDHCEPAKIGRSFIQFDLSDIPTGQTISQAILYLYLTNSCDAGERTHTVTAYRVTSSWSAGSVTWNSQPGYAEAYGSRAIPSRTWGWYTLDVTGLVQGWVNGAFPNRGLVVRGPESSGDSSARLGFLTVDNDGRSYDPVMVLSYTWTSAAAASIPEAGARPSSAGPTIDDLLGSTTGASAGDPYQEVEDPAFLAD